LWWRWSWCCLLKAIIKITKFSVFLSVFKIIEIISKTAV